MDYDANVKTDILNDLKSVSTPEVRKQFKRLDTVEETELQSNMEERAGSMDNNECSGGLMASINEGSAITSELNQDTMGPERGDQSSLSNQGIGSAITSIREHEEQSPISVLETHFRDDITCLVEFPMSEGMAYCLLLQNAFIQALKFVLFFWGYFVDPIPCIIGFARYVNSIDCMDLVKKHSLDLLI
jgi:hypothetical protein